MRALRRHHAQRVAQNRRRFVRDAQLSDHFLERSDNELAKRHPLDCGSHCELCHWAKFHEPRRAREKRRWRSEVA